MSDAWNARANSFDSRALQYEDVRPSYPAEAIDTILAFGEFAPGARALEIGAGTGKATRLMVERGLEVTALEPGAQLIDVARAACPERAVFHETSFEDWPLEPSRYDLVFAATSFHWVDQETGYAKAGDALRPGGTLALFWNRPGLVDTPLQARLDALYRDIAPDLRELTADALVEIEESIRTCIRACERFEEPETQGIAWSDRMETRRYRALLETYSAHATLPDLEREHLLAAVGALVDEAGGWIDVHYENVVHLARRT